MPIIARIKIVGEVYIIQKLVLFVWVDTNFASEDCCGVQNSFLGSIGNRKVVWVG